MESVIVTGSKGLIGQEITNHLSKTHKIFELDLILGHDLNDEKFVKKWFSLNPAEYLVNCFGLNDHISKLNNGQNSFDPSNSLSSSDDIYSISLESINKYLNINVTVLFSVCREFAKHSISSSIINFSSTYGLLSPLPSLYKNKQKHIGYCVSKASVIQMSKYLAVHLSKNNIRVNCIVPGGIHHMQSDSFIKNYSDRVPINRMMEKNELNGLIAYLCSNESSYMTGSSITIDGGWSAW